MATSNVDDVRLERASPDDAPALSEIAIRAFHSDVDYGGSGHGGPPGYDSPPTQVVYMRHCDYYRIMLGPDTLGALLVLRKGRAHCECVGVWVDPDRHRQGVGRRAFELAFALYPDATRWTVETPLWNTRAKGL